MTSIDKSGASITDLSMSSGVIYQLVTAGSWHAAHTAAHTAVTAAQPADSAAYLSSKSNKTKYFRLQSEGDPKRPEREQLRCSALDKLVLDGQTDRHSNT